MHPYENPAKNKQVTHKEGPESRGQEESNVYSSCFSWASSPTSPSSHDQDNERYSMGLPYICPVPSTPLAPPLAVLKAVLYQSHGLFGKGKTNLPALEAALLVMEAQRALALVMQPKACGDLRRERERAEAPKRSAHTLGIQHWTQESHYI